MIFWGSFKSSEQGNELVGDY